MPSHPERVNVTAEAEADYQDKLPDYLIEQKRKLWENGKRFAEQSAYQQELLAKAGLKR